MAVTQRVTPINWERQLQAEFGYNINSFRAMGHGGNYHKVQFKIFVDRWPMNEDGYIIDEPLRLHAQGDSMEDAMEILKTKLRLLT